MEPFATAVDRALASRAITPNQVIASANNDLAARGIRQPGGLLARNIEKFTLDAFQVIFDAVAEERLRRKEDDQAALRDQAKAYLVAKFTPLQDFAASTAAGRPSSFKATANALADKLFLQASLP